MRRAWWASVALVLALVAAAPALGAPPDFVLPSRAEEVDAALAQWDVDRAAALASSISARSPNDAVGLLAQAKVAFYQADHARSRDLARRAAAAALGHDASMAGDAKALAGYLDEREPTWRQFREHRSAHFVLRVTPRDEVLVPYALQALEAAAQAMQQEFGFPPPSGVVVEIYPTRRQFIQASTLKREEVETSGTLAICHFNRVMLLSPGVLAHGYDWLDALCHEYVHYTVYHLGGNTVPVWLHEGIAKLLESRWRVAQPEPLDPRLESVLAEGLQAGKWVTFAQMHPSMAKLPSAALVSMAFAEVAETTAMMRAEHGATALGDLIVALRDHGGDMDAALGAAWGLDLQRLEQQSRTRIQALPLKRVPGLRAFEQDKAAGLDFKDEGEHPNDPEEEARKLEDRKAQDFTILGDRLKGRQFYDAAIVEYDKALARTGQGEPLLVDKKAHALVLSGHADRALPLLEESLKYAPTFAVTLDNLAEIEQRLAQAAKDPAESAAHWQRALERTTASELINPFDTDTQLRLASLYEHFGRKEDAERARDRLAALRSSEK